MAITLASPAHAAASRADSGTTSGGPRSKAAGKSPGKPTGKPAGKPAGKSTARTAAVHGKPRPKAGKPAPAPPKAAAIPAPKGKVAVFAFDGDGATPLRARVVHLLRAKGLQVVTTLRPVDTPEQYREMADTLVLVAFLDGEAAEDGDQGSLTIHLRSGVSGLRVASTTLAGERRKLSGEIDKTLWDQLSPPLARICADAAKPRKRDREPMRIEAGTPLDNPADPQAAPAKKGT